MTRIKGPGSDLTSRAVAAAEGSEPAGEAKKASEVCAAEAIATSPASVRDAAMKAIFDAVAADRASGAFETQTLAIEAAVRGVLAEQMSHLTETTRQQIAGEIARLLLDDPVLSEQVERLLSR